MTVIEVEAESPLKDFLYVGKIDIHSAFVQVVEKVKQALFY